MKKKTLLCLITICLLGLLHGSANAEDNAVQEVVRLTIEGKQVPSSLLLKATNEKAQPEKKIDLFLDTLLQTPPEQRQYVFPAVFESPFTPQKVRTHPEIAIWKGTVPTRIAPQLTEFAGKYLEDLNPILYIYLAPESFPQPDTATQNLRITRTELRKHSIPSEQSNFTGYQSIRSYIRLPKELEENPNLAKLTPQKIDALAGGFATLQSFLLNQPNPKEFMNSLNLLELFHTDPNENMINPIQSLFDRIRLLKQGDKLNDAFVAAGWEDANSFAEAADTAAKAYRVHSLSLPVAFSYRKIKGKSGPLNFSDEVMLTAALMHEALPADVRLVEEKMSDIYNAFKQAGYQYLLKPVSVDSPNKMEYTVPSVN